MKKVNVAIVGATGMVGRTFLKVLEERKFPINQLYLFSSAKSAGSTVVFNGKEYVVEELNKDVFDRDIQIALFSAGGEISSIYAPIAASKGIVVIDNSSYWRMDENVPLVVPEVNPQDIKKHKGIIANPNCSTIQAVVPLKALHEKYKIKRIVYSTYQAVSGSGVRGIKDLEDGVDGKPNSFYPHPIAYNCLPHIDVFEDNGYTKEELKMINETKKIFNDFDMKVTATTVRVPVKNSHSESINIEFENPFELSDLVNTLENMNGVIVMDNPKENKYPTTVDSTGRDEVFVGRIRRDFSVDNGVNIWVVADNIRKGAATNTVQIAELLVACDLV
ncbi:aspartate-semialdehyde dehydrogenase [Romboutsia sp. 1001216sp1]|uniref:aspartate-semialdehyde dehydrogenase n=1 Tax=Romboutsia TaxID=1501226 RepID=UPI000A717ED9|nr:MULTISPECIES: aspartate-semialdehyde dehydrogenase [Romboutsia]MDB8793218.1 aspartate-semialdehyde dehydrogenase [Romboutsia sp. 1001216sp1]MDB8796010.1 aspartate-semialdehyde dehydrogenase [Romboutsia sp. 1001216sp1]MDB8799506.1 aspartate-semialdehyde dehydrogenase [Romboutsia sp. 1001216sp1]MDB8805338.1 aspartate-semialdehyde dehydrogenase [Romboutsia sp. 1001216sp1]MDB8806988.1 aspartate-semialdehyde dehydrogenase [Romboutsia sp. 1001216sp1]